MSNILKGLKKVDGKKTGIFAAGVLFGTAGIKVLSSKDAKKLYTNCTAAVLRAKEEQEYAEAVAAEEAEEAEEAAEADETDFAEETAE